MRGKCAAEEETEHWKEREKGEEKKLLGECLSHGPEGWNSPVINCQENFPSGFN